MATRRAQTSTPPEVFTRRLREVVLAAILGVFLLLTFLWALERLRGLLVLIAFSLFCGFALEPAVNRLARRGWSRGLAALAVFLAVAVVVAAFCALLGTIVVRQITDLVASLPDYTERVAEFLQD